MRLRAITSPRRLRRSLSVVAVVLHLALVALAAPCRCEARSSARADAASCCCPKPEASCCSAKQGAPSEGQSAPRCGDGVSGELACGVATSPSATFERAAARELLVAPVVVALLDCPVASTLRAPPGSSPPPLGLVLCRSTVLRI